MTETIKRDDERRTHRITTYLSASEYNDFYSTFETSDIDNFSQYHRQVIIDSLTHSEHRFKIPQINSDVAETLTIAVHSSCRLIAQLEMFSLLSEGANFGDALQKIDDLARKISAIGEICYRWARWYREDFEAKAVVADIAAITLSSHELYVLADAVNKAEDAQ